MKTNSISVRINVLILVLVVIIGGGLVEAAYHTNSKQVDELYMERTSQTASTIAAYVNADKISKVVDFFLTDEYQALRAEAAETEDVEKVERYLEEKGFLSEIMSLYKVLSSFRDLQGAKYVYLISSMEDKAISICDPDEPMTVLGEIRPNAGEFGAYQTNAHIDPTVSRTDYGWLCSAYDPVISSRGEAVCMVGVDIDMTDVMKARQSFMWTMLSFAGAVGLIALAVGVWMMHKSVVKPLKMLSKATDEFADPDVEFTRENVINLPITSKDEIGDLYRKTRNMQLQLVDYMDNLTQVTTEKERISTELNVANRIQADMLPRIFPPFPNRNEFDIYALMDPAKEVGGDFYDFFLVDEDHLAMVVADVSGKGVPAALFMVIAKTLIKNRAQMGDSPSEVLRNVNNQLCEGNDAELFVTVWMGIMEISTGHGWAVNAGHEHPVLRRAGGDFELVQYRHSPAVAVMPGINFKQHEFHLDPGDTLFVYSDGVPEATSAQEELFGNERMLQALNKHKDLKPQELLNTMHKDIDDFVGEAPQFDDITMLMMNYKGPAKEKVEELEIEAKVENLTRVLGFIDDHLERRGCSMKAQTQLDIAVEEVFVNIASYAYGGAPGRAVIQLRETHDPEGVSITFIDEGVPYDPLAKPDPDVTLAAEDRPIGGLGIFMVKKTMDDMVYEYKNQRNMLTLKKNF